MFLSPQDGKDACILLLLFMEHWLNFITSAIKKSHYIKTQTAKGFIKGI